MAYRYFAAVIAALFLAICGGPAYADCSGPTATEGKFVYNQDFHTYQYCDGTSWKSFADIDPAAGGPGCTNPTHAEGVLIYNDDFNVMQFCNGTNWVAVGQASSGVGCSCPTFGLVAHWKLDESGNISTATASTGSINGTLTNFPADPTARWLSGQVSGALRFDGINDYVALGTGTALQPASLTVALWIRREASWNGTDGWIMDTKGGTWTANGWYLEIGGASGHALALTVDGANYGYMTGAPNPDTEFPLNTWVHVAATFDTATNQIKIYLDGVDRAVTIAGSPSTISSSASNKNFGSASFRVPASSIDDMRIYDRALSAAEIATLHGATCN